MLNNLKQDGGISADGIRICVGEFIPGLSQQAFEPSLRHVDRVGSQLLSPDLATP